MSRAQKKNQKRAEKRAENKMKDNDVEEEVVDPVEALKQRLAKAKADEDHKQVAELRKDLWVLQDTLSGHNPDIPQEEVNQSLQRIETLIKGNKSSSSTDKCDNVTYNYPIDTQDKALIKLQKKLEQIETLKRRMSSGEKLEKNQLTKIQSENDVRREIEEYLEMKRTLHGTNSA